MIELHHWERAIGGRTVRAFEYVGESGDVTDWRGDPDPVEIAIDLPATRPDGGDVVAIVDERDVMRVADAWSVDPTGLDGQPASGPLRAAAVGQTPEVTR